MFFELVKLLRTWYLFRDGVNLFIFYSVFSFVGLDDLSFEEVRLNAYDANLSQNANSYVNIFLCAVMLSLRNKM